jgi:hypothetical protein
VFLKGTVYAREERMVLIDDQDEFASSEPKRVEALVGKRRHGKAVLQPSV